MGVFDSIKEKARSFSGYLFEEDDYDYDDEFSEDIKKTEAKAELKERRDQMESTEMAERFAPPLQPQPSFVPQPPRMDRPKLTVHENPSLKIKVFKPKSFDEVRHIADCLKNKQAVIINYEAIELHEQLRISDFMNGACYVLNGNAQMITKYSVLYVPQNVSISKDMFSYDSMPSFAKASEG
jgi:cell division inhibitor SepF